ncbi:MAG: ATP synthase F0 subunit C [Deltaproteobacteria bacterium]|jgi:F-type H+-transporting ATPase subunit c|nr:ATP synthase F0 subunit C [Deltaproteobacteria bacterium]
MKKTAVFLLTALVMTFVSAAVAMAADGDNVSPALGTVSAIAIAAGIGMALATVGTGIGQGFAIYGACTGIARNPEVAGTIRVNMIIGLAIIESLCIYALVVELLLLFAFPYSDLITKFLQ